MPFTTYHLASGILIGLLTRKKVHWPTLIMATVLVDVEPLLVFTTGFAYPLHGYAHTFLASLLLGSLVGLLMQYLDKHLQPFYRALYLVQQSASSLRSFIAGGIMGWAMHVLMDAPLYSDIKPLTPLQYNPFSLYSSSELLDLVSIVYDAVLVAGPIAYLIYFYSQSSKSLGSTLSRLQLGALVILASGFVPLRGFTVVVLHNALVVALLVILLGLVLIAHSLLELKLLSEIRLVLVAALLLSAIAVVIVLYEWGFLLSWILVALALLALRGPLVCLKIVGRIPVVDVLIAGWVLLLIVVGAVLLLLSLILIVVKAADLAMCTTSNVPQSTIA